MHYRSIFATVAARPRVGVPYSDRFLLRALFTVMVVVVPFGKARTQDFMIEVPPVAPSAAIEALAVGDVSGDGHGDLVWVRKTPPLGPASIHVWLNDGLGCYCATILEYPLVGGTRPTDLVLMDVDQDAHLDVVVSSENPGTITVLTNRGIGGGPWKGFDSSIYASYGSRPQSLAAGDLNGDGLPDLVVGVFAWHEVTVQMNLGVDVTGAWQGFGAPVLVSQMAFPRDVVVADFDGDGRLDIVAAASSLMSGLWVMWNDSATGYSPIDFEWVGPPASPLNPVPSQPTGIAASDLNGDDVVDLVVRCAGSDAQVFLGNGYRGSSASDSFVHFDTGYWRDAWDCATGDFNADGRVDVIAAHPSALGMVLLSVAVNVSMLGAMAMPLAPSSFWHRPVEEAESAVVAVGEHSGDYMVDFVSATDPAGLTLYVNAMPTPPRWFRRGDANRDGGVDVSDAVFSLASLFIIDAPASTCLDAADANDDGVVDVSDVVTTLSTLFVPGGLIIPPPSPGTGPDPTDDALTCEP